MSPYRSDHGSGATRPDAPADTGIVGDIIAQFADQLAFLRELVQNSIDAGSPSIEVRLDWEAGEVADRAGSAREGRLRVSIRDRGEGMTRDILENQLLVLFRSTKEHDRSKIGKFGIGFASVLATNPEVVTVSTSRDGRRLVLHLHRDLTFQIYDGGPVTQTGTTVELELAMHDGAVEAFVEKAIAALERWCPHAAVPITVTANLPDRPEPVTARIDRPLSLDRALIEVHERSSDGALTAVAGILPGATPYTGLFNHGLMLFETTEPLLGRVAVKLQDARLGHTLSRDDVRRDAHFDRAIDFARSIVAQQLPAAASAALRQAAEAGEHEAWTALALAVVTSGLELSRAAWWFPLVEPAASDIRAIDGCAIGRSSWCAERPSRLTALLAENGQAVLYAPAGDLVRSLVDAVAGGELREVAVELTAVRPIEPALEDDALVALMHEMFAATHRAPSAIVVAELEGVHADVLALTSSSATAVMLPHLLDLDQAARSPFGRKRLPLVFSARHAWYRAARGLDPRAGAALLARLMLLQHGLLDVPRSTTLLELTLDRIGLDP